MTATVRYWVWRLREGSTCAPFFSHQKRYGGVGVVRVGCLLEGKYILKATALFVSRIIENNGLIELNKPWIIIILLYN
jgi:hypothetical protein